jgi:hypothetical protein
VIFLRERESEEATHDEMLPIPLAKANRLKMSVAMVGSSSDRGKRSSVSSLSALDLTSRKTHSR